MKRWLSVPILACSLIGCPNLSSDDLSSDEFDDLRQVTISETEAMSVNLGVSETVLVVDHDNNLQLQALPLGCRTIVSGSETDLDSDTIPDDVTYEFDPSKCVKALPDNRNRTIGGRIRVEDTAVKPSLGYRFTYIDLVTTERRFGVQTFSETRNGTRSAGLSADKLQLNRGNDLLLELKRPAQLLQTLRNQMNLVFMASQPIVLNQTFPAGTIQLSGQVQWTRGTFASRSYTTTTETQLQTDPTCASQRIVGGIQVLTRGKLTLQFAYQPCGMPPIVTKILN